MVDRETDVGQWVDRLWGRRSTDDAAEYVIGYIASTKYDSGNIRRADVTRLANAMAAWHIVLVLRGDAALPKDEVAPAVKAVLARLQEGA
jgi:hypothetical protein